MTATEPLLLRRRIAAAVAVLACASVALLAWLGYVAVREWQKTVWVLAERAANEASDVLLTGLTRDMRAVHRSVLSSPALNAFTLRPPYEAFSLVAGAFARYQYPESFFLWRAETGTAGMFLHRRDRQPSWARPLPDRNHFPVTVESDAPSVRGLLDRIRVDADNARRFSVFETAIGGVSYQVVARLFYRDELSLELDAVLGFIVNLEWVRQHYFAELLLEDVWTRGARADVLLAIRDERGRMVASTGADPAAGVLPGDRRTFPLMFFNPQLIAANPPEDLPRYTWDLLAMVRDDSSLIAATSAGTRMLVLQAIAAGALAIGLVLTVRASRASMKLAALRSEFVSSVTHEFKTPIATIRAAGQSLAAARITDAAAQQEYAGFIVQEAQRLARLVDNLLAFSKITDSGTVQTTRGEPISLAALVQETLRRFSLHFREGHFAVETSIDPDLPPIAGDRATLELMLDNLIDNAIRHSRTLRHLHVRAFARDDQVVLEVADRGGGIAEDEVKLVTQKFYRGREAGQGGTGLGLSIVKRIAAEHAGTFAIRSEPGHGTTVTVAFPRLRTDSRPAGSPPVAVHAS